MQNPVGAAFNPDTMRMELTSVWDLLFNPTAQSKFVHTVSAGYVTGSMFVLAVSAWYLLRGRHIEIARRSMTVAVSFGLASALSVVVLGDESGYTTTQNQKTKLAAMEGLWHSEPAPAGLTIFGLPSQESRQTRYAVRIPWVLGLISTRSINTVVPGIFELVDEAKERIHHGVEVYVAVQRLRANPNDAAARGIIDEGQRDLGYAMLLRRYVADPAKATDQQIEQAAWDTVPNVPVLFWAFRVMVALGFYFIALFAVMFVVAARRQLERRRWLLWIAYCSLPLPWIAAEVGWIVAEHGRQPWIIEGMLPTFLAASAIPAGNVLISLVGFVVFYTALLVVDLFLLVKYSRIGPTESWQVPDLAARQAPPGGVIVDRVSLRPGPLLSE
jgi:cytochrome bd ubiquinol oxidase subunit I